MLLEVGPSSSSDGGGDDAQPAPARQQPSSSAPHKPAAAAPARAQQQQQQQQQPLVDVDKYAELLAPLVGNTGGVTDPGCVPGLVAILPQFPSSLARTLVCTVLLLSSQSALAALMAAPGAVDTLSSWMLAAMAEDSDAAAGLLVEALGVLRKLPVTRAFVQATKSAKVVGALRKHDNREVAALAKAVVGAWMKVVAAGGAAGGSSRCVRACFRAGWG
jgi:hypothetical protein